MDSQWIKSSFSAQPGENCVEMRFNDDADSVDVRDSKNPTQGQLNVKRSEYAAFVQGIKAGEFNF